MLPVLSTATLPQTRRKDAVSHFYRSNHRPSGHATSLTLAFGPAQWQFRHPGLHEIQGTILRRPLEPAVKPDWQHCHETMATQLMYAPSKATHSLQTYRTM